MSGLQTPSSVVGTAVDPASPAGVIIDPYTEIAGSPGLDDVIKGDGLGGWTVGSAPIPVGAVNYKGVWDAFNNVPALTSGMGTQGDYYVVGTAGATPLDGISDWEVTDWAIFNGTVWEKVDNTEPNVCLLEFSTVLGVPNAGVRYLDRAGITCSTVPTLLPDAAVLKGITVYVDTVDPARAYAAEIITNPGGVPVTLAGLALPLSTISASRRDLTVSIPAGTNWGVRLRKTNAVVGVSSFTNARVEVEVKMP